VENVTTGENPNGVAVALDDDKLMGMIARGEETAFSLLVSRWENAVFAFLFHMVGSAADAEDLSQDTFMKVFTQAGKYRANGRFRSWLFRIAGNKARSWLRRRKILTWIRFDVTRHDRNDRTRLPDQVLAGKEMAVAVQAALQKIPERQRQAVVLRRYQGMSYREIAEILDTTLPAVESLLQRAAAGLRKELAGKGDWL